MLLFFRAASLFLFELMFLTALRPRPRGLECGLMNNILGWDEMTSTLGKPRLAFTLVVAEPQLTLRELIRARVAQEVPPGRG